MAKENAVLGGKLKTEEGIYDSFDFDELEAKLQGELEAEFEDLDFLKEEKEMISNPDNLGEVIQGVVWEQFINQIAVTAGEDFIKDNRELLNRGEKIDRSKPITKEDVESYHLDLRKEAHIQTTENFANGKIATHNAKIDYQKRYDDWQNNFQRNDDGTIKTKVDRRSGEERAVLRTADKKKDPNGENYNTNYNAREYIDKDRPKGSKTVHKDHTISAAEIIRDAEANAHMTREEQAAFANSDVNLIDLDSRANESKSDSTMTEWLDSERNGEKPADRFPIDEAELRERDKVAREEYEKQKKEGEQRSIKAGKKSQREEAFRIGGKALRAVLMQLLAELVREIIAKLVKWFKSAKRTIESLLDSLKEAIHAFIGKMKTHLINAGDTVFTTVATAIVGPIVSTIKKVWTMLKQGWKSLKDAVNYIKSPENKGKPIGRLMLEVGKIVIAGMTGIGALVLGEVIEKGLMTVPILAVDIPLIGSLANIIGVFFGAVVAGIIGAIAINLIEKRIEKDQKAENTEAQLNKGNEILRTQHQLQAVSEAKLAQEKFQKAESIKERHQKANDVIRESLDNIADNCKEDDTIDDMFADIDNLFEELEED